MAVNLFGSQQRTGPQQLDVGVACVNTQVSWIKPRSRRWNFRMALWQARSIGQLQSEALTSTSSKGYPSWQQETATGNKMSLELPSCYQPAEAALVLLLPETPSIIPGEKEGERPFRIVFGWFISISHQRSCVISL